MKCYGKFRKKPVVIEAFQYLHDCDGNFVRPDWFDGISDKSTYGVYFLIVNTLDGLVVALSGDWIIKGVKGEQYPCRNDIFEATYEECDNWEGE